MPEGAVISGIKSKSHKATGYNELSMDDTPGKEKFTIHGQYDMASTIKHDQTTTVHNNRTDKVDVDDSETVGNNQTQTVGVNQTIKVGVDHHDGVLTVPVEALAMEKANAFVFKVADGKAKKTAVKLGFNDGANVEITEGLADGEGVIVPGKVPPADGQPVKPEAAK